jgi:signal transduction histidine kinase
MSSPSAAQLRAIDLFDGLSDAELESWAGAAELRTLAPGQLVADQGQAGQPFCIVLEGSLEAFALDGDGRASPVGEHAAPTWIGAIAALTNGVSGVRMQAATPVTLAAIETPAFVELVLAHRAVFETVMGQVRPVVTRVTAFEQGRERLASLGTMAAGLAHELNNPAAAAQRAAADMAEALDVLSSTIARFVESGIEREQAEKLIELQREALAGAAEASAARGLDAADAEDDLLDALEDLQVPEPWRLAEPLATAGVDRAWLQRVAEHAGSATGSAVRWVAASLTARNLAGELSEATQRMSGLVGAVKEYAYMDRGELVEVDIHDGLDTTLTVLGHKLRHTGISVERHYDTSLPRMTVYGGELNQVWTNLLDNAIGALGESGTITLSTSLEAAYVRVDIADDGPGIAPDDIERIFDPFFTTKRAGQGTGLGLDAVRRIIVERHRGSVTVESEPGRTVFHVRLPLQRSAGDDAAQPATEQESDR